MRRRGTAADARDRRSHDVGRPPRTGDPRHAAVDVARLGIGLVIGLCASVVGSRLLAGSLYGLSPFDPPAYIGVALLLSVAALAATCSPAQRAMRVDPTIALRCE